MSFLSPMHVRRFEAFGAKMQVSMAGFWCFASPDVLRRRVATRNKGSSDGTVEHLERMLQNCSGACPRSWIPLNTALGYKLIERKVRNYFARP